MQFVVLIMSQLVIDIVRILQLIMNASESKALYLINSNHVTNHESLHLLTLFSIFENPTDSEFLFSEMIKINKYTLSC